MLCGFLCLVACRGGSEAGRGASLASARPSAAIPARAPAIEPAASAAPPAPPTGSAAGGSWSGSYDSVAHRLELPPKLGGLPVWKIDDGKRGAGHGKIMITVQADGTVSGTATGPLGDEAVRGAIEGGAFSARLVPSSTDLPGYSGTLVGHRDGDHLTGTLAAASSDGVVAREGTLTLARGSR
jgi:hypothetical protein